LDPNATLPSIIAGGAAGAGAGATTAAPAILPAAKASGLTLKELQELGSNLSSPLTAAGISGHPLVGAALAVPAAAKAGWDLIKMMAEKVPARFLPLAPGLGAEAGKYGSTVAQQQPGGYF
jgi:hypothetical protein